MLQGWFSAWRCWGEWGKSPFSPQQVMGSMHGGISGEGLRMLDNHFLNQTHEYSF